MKKHLEPIKAASLCRIAPTRKNIINPIAKLNTDDMNRPLSHLLINFRK